MSGTTQKTKKRAYLQDSEDETMENKTEELREKERQANAAVKKAHAAAISARKFAKQAKMLASAGKARPGRTKKTDRSIANQAKQQRLQANRTLIDASKEAKRRKQERSAFGLFGSTTKERSSASARTKGVSKRSRKA